MESMETTGRSFRVLSRRSNHGRLQSPYVLKNMGGCQNYGPFLGTLNNRCRILIGTQKGTIILTTTQKLHLRPTGLGSQGGYRNASARNTPTRRNATHLIAVQRPA